MKIALWCCWALLAYTYFGYLGWLRLRTAWRSRPVHKAPVTPSASIVLAVFNEERQITKKLRNLADLDYSTDKTEIIVVSDGSTDGTNTLLSQITGLNFRVIACERHVGKAEALNRGVAEASGDIVVFTDARQMIEQKALRELMANFADPNVGCVSGELMLAEDGSLDGIAKPMGLYWRYEKLIRKLESQTGSVVGATGAFYAARRSLIPHVTPGTLLDDVFIPISIARAGYRVVFEPEARAWDVAACDPKTEFRRKVRTLTGNYQLLGLAPWVLSRQNPLWRELISHKLLRLAFPLIAGVAFCISMFVRDFWSIAFCAGVLSLLGAATLAYLRILIPPLTSACNVALGFVVLNFGAMVALFNVICRRNVIWTAAGSESGVLSAVQSIGEVPSRLQYSEGTGRGDHVPLQSYANGSADVGSDHDRSDAA